MCHVLGLYAAKVVKMTFLECCSFQYNSVSLFIEIIDTRRNKFVKQTVFIYKTLDLITSTAVECHIVYDTSDLIL